MFTISTQEKWLTFIQATLVWKLGRKGLWENLLLILEYHMMIVELHEQ